MQPIQRNEILPLGEYETIRPAFRARVIEEKRSRRVALGEHLSAYFEDRDTVMLQIQEMLRTERITSESGILHELETYNELLPGEGQLSLTLFVEIPDHELRDRMLQELAGLERSVWLEVEGERYAAHPLRGDSDMPGRTTAVHFFRIALPNEAAASLRARRARAAIIVDHPRYSARGGLAAAALASMAEHLA